MEATDSFLFTDLQQEVERCQVWCVCFWQVGCPSTPRPLSPACQESPNQDIFTSGTQRILHLLASHSQFSSCQVARLCFSLPIPSPTRPSLLSAPGCLVPCAPPPLPSGPNRVPPAPRLPSLEGRAQGPGVSCTRWPAVRRRLRPQAGAAPPPGKEPAHWARGDPGRALTEKIMRRRAPRSASDRHSASEPSPRRELPRPLPQPPPLASWLPCVLRRRCRQVIALAQSRGDLWDWQFGPAASGASSAFTPQPPPPSPPQAGAVFRGWVTAKGLPETCSLKTRSCSRVRYR